MFPSCNISISNVFKPSSPSAQYKVPGEKLKSDPKVAELPVDNAYSTEAAPSDPAER